MPVQPALFESHAIRRIYDEESEVGWFSVVDIVQVLTQQSDYQTARKYWNKLKERLGKEGSQSVTDCHRLNMPAADGKNYLTDVASAESLPPAGAAPRWGVVEGSRIRREYPITLGRLEGGGGRGKALCAHYVLEYRNTRLAVAEAKAWDKALTEGVAQAKDYAGKQALRLTCSDALADLGKPEEIGRVFSGFQKYLYAEAT